VIAAHLANLGASVAIQGTTATSTRAFGEADSLATVAKSIEADSGSKVVPVYGNLADPEVVRNLVGEIRAALGRIDILVNCAGYVHQGTVLECSERDWDFSFDLNVKSIHRTLTAFLPAMLKNGGGSIVNIASAVSSIRGVPNRYVYGATKAAIIGLTKAVAADYIKQGIRCNAICPGTIRSPSFEERVDATAAKTGQSQAKTYQDFVDRQPMGRLGTPDEVAALAVFLASDESRFITGQPHLVDGGMAL